MALMAYLPLTLIPLGMLAAEAGGADAQPAAGKLWSAVAADGHDVVALADQAQVVPGDPSHSAWFGAQEYRFATAAAHAQFLAGPDRYAPVLAGACIVTWSEEHRLVPGTVQEAVVAHGRLYLFATAAARQRFLLNPLAYYEADLLLAGDSPVALVETGRQVRGRVEHEVRHEGRRYRLRDAREADLWRGDLGRYLPVADGRDPVSLIEGMPAAGHAEWSLRYKDRLYLFASRANRERFQAEPARYADVDVAAAGICPVTLQQTGMRRPGHWGVSTIYRGGRFLFASAEHRRLFLATPSVFVTAELLGE